MIGQILGYIHNYFEKSILRGNVSIYNGELRVDGESVPIVNGQYYRIRGSVFNDGVFVYPDDTSIDEVFDGEVWLLAIPRDVISICNEIVAWETKYGGIANSPYSSESFGGYSYSKAQGSGSSSSVSWQSVFGSRLNAWRKIACP